MIQRLAFAFLCIASAPPVLAAQITSDFETNADDWRHGTYTSDLTQDVEHVGSRGYIQADNGWYAGGFLAPQKYLGDKLAFIGGELSFQLSTEMTPPAGTLLPALILTGAGGQSIFANWGPVPGPEFTYFTVSLTADSFYKGSFEQRISGVTAEEFASIIGNLNRLLINADWSGGAIVRLDAVSMSSPNAVPEPASWALMIGGFGCLGGALRRRSPAKVAFA